VCKNKESPPPMRVHNNTYRFKNIGNKQTKNRRKKRHSLFKTSSNLILKKVRAFRIILIWYGQLKDEISTGTYGSSAEDPHSMNPFSDPSFYVECGSGFYDQEI
jgi:hypothetical protein